MKKKLLLMTFTVGFLSMYFIFCGCLRVSANSSEIVPFVVGDQVETGLLITSVNVSSSPTKAYVFVDDINNPTFTIGFNFEDDVFYYSIEHVEQPTVFDDSVESIEVGVYHDGNGNRVILPVDTWICVQVALQSNSGEIGLIPDVDNSPIYQGIYDLLQTLIYGDKELSTSDVALLTYFSIGFTIILLMIPFILMFIIFKLMFSRWF